MKQKKELSVEQLIRQLLKKIDDSPGREGLKNTPARVAKVYQEIFSGYSQDPNSVFVTFDGGKHNGLVVISDINFYSMCEHHLMPFFGKVHIGYLPNKKVVGLSKFARLVDIFSKRLQIQERLTEQIAKTIYKNLHTSSCIVHVEAAHLCMTMRGVKKDTSKVTTTVALGKLKDDLTLRQEFFQKINNNSHQEK